jgi:DNA-binding protein Fis
MKSKEVEKVLRFFNEPVKHERIWKMKTRYNFFEDIEGESYSECYDLALIEIKKLVI